jgi:hypothetical protein
VFRNYSLKLLPNIVLGKIMRSMYVLNNQALFQVFEASSKPVVIESSMTAGHCPIIFMETHTDPIQNLLGPPPLRLNTRPAYMITSTHPDIILTAFLLNHYLETEIINLRLCR